MVELGRDSVPELAVVLGCNFDSRESKRRLPLNAHTESRQRDLRVTELRSRALERFRSVMLTHLMVTHSDAREPRATERQKGTTRVPGGKHHIYVIQQST